MRLGAPLLLLVLGCGILAPEDDTRVKVWYAANDLGVMFRAESHPPDTVFYRLDVFYDGERTETVGVDPDGSVDHALVWFPEIMVVAKFKAWGPRARPDSIWFGHVADTVLGNQKD